MQAFYADHFVLPLPEGHRFPMAKYALLRDALIQHGPVKGGWLTVRRLCKCHPFGGSGYDPVPPVKD